MESPAEINKRLGNHQASHAVGHRTQLSTLNYQKEKEQSDLDGNEPKITENSNHTKDNLKQNPSTEKHAGQKDNKKEKGNVSPFWCELGGETSTQSSSFAVIM